MFHKLVVIGLGYIGLPTSAMFAESGLSVVGVDIEPHIVDTINRGEMHIIEPGLDRIVASVVRLEQLRASLQVEEANAFIIAVPTPFDDEKKPDLSYVKAATDSVAPHLRQGNLVVLESTSPVGTTEQV